MSQLIIKVVLLVEDNPGDARLLREMLYEGSSPDITLACASSMGEAETYLAEQVFDTILLDLGLPDTQGLAAIRRARSAAPGIPLVVLTGTDDLELAARSLQEGVQEFLIKGQIDSRGLLRALRYATERKRVEQLKDEFVATVSHELRTPLTSITTSLGLLIGKVAPDLPGPAVRLLAIAHANSQRLVRLVNDILDVEKLESGHAVFHFSRLEVRSLVEETIEALRGFAEGHGVRIRIESVWMAAEVRADADRLAQVITNLLSNAVKYSPSGSEVVVTIGNLGGVVRISVRDHGAGIPDEFKSRIFDRFAQAESPNARQRSGTGLGLSIVKQIVDRLSGHVGFFDAPGGGTIFYVELPGWDNETEFRSTRADANERPHVQHAGQRPGVIAAAIDAPAIQVAAIQVVI